MAKTAPASAPATTPATVTAPAPAPADSFLDPNLHNLLSIITYIRICGF